MTERRDSDKWRFDKSIPLPMLFAFLMQGCVLVWWGATITQRMVSVEDYIRVRQLLPERIARLEAQQQRTNDILEQILRQVSHNSSGNR